MIKYVLWANFENVHKEGGVTLASQRREIRSPWLRAELKFESSCDTRKLNFKKRDFDIGLLKQYGAPWEVPVCFLKITPPYSAVSMNPLRSLRRVRCLAPPTEVVNLTPLPPHPNPILYSRQNPVGNAHFFAASKDSFWSPWKQSAGNTLVDRNVAGHQAKKTYCSCCIFNLLRWVRWAIPKSNIGQFWNEYYLCCLITIHMNINFWNY